MKDSTGARKIPLTVTNTWHSQLKTKQTKTKQTNARNPQSKSLQSDIFQQKEADFKLSKMKEEIKENME